MNIIEYKKNLELKMCRCNHLFIKLKDEEYISDMNSSDCFYMPCIVECLKCGLTNKYLDLGYSDFYIFNLFIKINNKVFLEQFGKSFKRGGKSFDSNNLTLIFEERSIFYNPRELYRIAKDLYPDANNSEIFDVMKQLHNKKSNKKIKKSTNVN